MSTLLSWFIGILVWALPASTGLPASVSDAFSTFLAYLNQLNYLLPIDTLFQVVAWYLALDLALMTFHALRMVANFFRGSGA